MGDDMATDTTHVIAKVKYTRFEFLCFAYLIGCVTAMNLEVFAIEEHNFYKVLD
jgi:hypothetical protein